MAYLERLYKAQAAFAGGRRIPPGISQDIALLYDPGTNADTAWVDGAEVTWSKTGSPTSEAKGTLNPQTALVTDASNFLTTTTLPFTDIDDEEELTCYAVVAQNSANALGSIVRAGLVWRGNYTADNFGLFHRTGSAVAGGLGGYKGATFGADYSGESIGQISTVAVVTGTWNGSELQAFYNGTGNAATSISGTNTSAYTTLQIGSTIDSEGATFYVLWVRGPRSAAVETWLTSTFPVGEDVSFGVTLPAGALFDFNPEVSVTEDQVGAVAISNGGSYAATADALQKGGLSRVAMDGTNSFTAAWPASLADYSAAMPFTVYCVVRSSEFDEGAYPFSAYAETNSSTNRILAQLVADSVRQNRQRIDSGAGNGFDDDVDTPFAPGTIQILSYEFFSTSQGRKSIDDTQGSLQTYNNARDPNDLDTLEIGGHQSSGVWDGDYFRFLIYPGATDQDVLDYLAEVYLERPNAGADLTISNGTAVFDFNPTAGGDFTAAVDASGNRVAGTTRPTNRFPSEQRLDGGVHGGLSFDETVDEHVEFESYPGAASLSACADGKATVYVVIDPLGNNVADYVWGFGVGTSSSQPRLYGRYNSTSGALSVEVDDDLNNISSESGGTGATSGSEVLAFYFEHDATNGMTIGAAAGGAAMTTSQKASVTGDVDLERLFLATDYRNRSISTFEGVIRRLVVVEGADYSTALATEILNSVTT